MVQILNTWYCLNDAIGIDDADIDAHLQANPYHKIVQILTTDVDPEPNIVLHVDVPEAPNDPVGNINASQILSVPVDDTLKQDRWILKYSAASQTLIYQPDIAEVVDHGDLIGLLDDDHSQYHNDVRGDIRYYTKTLLIGGALDTRYYTETEIDNLLALKSDVGHTHTANQITDFTFAVTNHVDVAANSAHRLNMNNPHGTRFANMGTGTLAELNAIISDATLDEAGDPRPLQVFRQITEPALLEDEVAIWVDTSDSNRVWFVFRRGLSDQVKVELS